MTVGLRVGIGKCARGGPETVADSAEEQRRGLFEAAVPHDVMVPACHRKKGVAHFGGGQRARHALARGEQRVLPTAGDPEPFEFGVGAGRIVEEGFATTSLAR